MTVCILTNLRKDPEFSYTSDVEAILDRFGIEHFRAPQTRDEDHFDYVDPKDFPRIPDAVIVLGGDGTLLSAATDLKGTDIPLLGINIGTLGYLTETEFAYAEDAVKKLAEGDYTIEKRMMIEGTPSFNDGRPSKGYVALNDVVLSRDRLSSIIELELSVNGRHLANYQADGLIIATPTGSTAYNLSAGGPIVEPTASLMISTPICSHNLGLRSLVLDPSDDIVITVGPGHKDPVEDVDVMIDGKHPFSLKSKESIRISQSKLSTRLIRLRSTGFWDTLRFKMEGK